MERTSLALDAANRAHVAMSDAGLGVIRYAMRTDDGWQVETGDMQGVRTSIEAIRAMPVLAPQDSMFLWSLEYLATKEGKTYREAELEMPDER